MNDTHRLSMNFLKLLDIVLVAFAFGLSTVFMVHAEQRYSLAQFLSMRTKVSDFVIFGFTLFLCHLVLCICGLYRPARDFPAEEQKYTDLLRATTLCTVCLLAGQLGLLDSNDHNPFPGALLGPEHRDYGFSARSLRPGARLHAHSWPESSLHADIQAPTFERPALPAGC